jgi:outer membrane protein OmpA-like peptidoglycan-associated protein
MASYCPLSHKFAVGLFLIGLFLSAATVSLPCKADEATADAIIAALKGHKTRSLTRPRPEAVAEFAHLREIRKTRGLTIQEREELVKVSKELPQIDLRILFNFDSEEVKPNGMKTLNEVARALKSKDLRGKSFVIAGHTDRKGAPDYNVDLSLRRAEAVKRILVADGIEADTIATVGFGFEQLANKNDPYAAENRRVQFVKWSD